MKTVMNYGQMPSYAYLQEKSKRLLHEKENFSCTDNNLELKIKFQKEYNLRVIFLEFFNPLIFLIPIRILYLPAPGVFAHLFQIIFRFPV